MQSLARMFTSPYGRQGYRIWPYRELGLMVRDAPQAALLTMRV
jgi:hypothetical protein